MTDEKMLSKMFNKSLIILFVLLILLVIPTCVTASEDSSLDLQESPIMDDTTHSTPHNAEPKQNSVNSKDNTTKASQNSEDYYFDINSEDDYGDGTEDNPYKNLKDGRIFNNSVIHLSNGEYNYSQLNSHTNITIYGEDAEKTIINGNGGTIHIDENFILRNVTLFNITINNQAKLKAYNTIFSSSTAPPIGQYSEAFGGAIYSIGQDDVYLDNCTFKNNHADYGGAIYMNGGLLTIIDSQFINNSANNYGGAIACEREYSESHISIQRSNFINDSSINDAGGAIYLKYTYSNIDNTNFTSCSANFGGAIASLKSDLQLNNLLLDTNYARYDGGAIYHIYDKLTINNSNFLNNNATNGGAIYSIFSDNSKINNNIFTTNNASNGGALTLNEYNGTVKDNKFFNNQANNFGNAIYLISNQNSTTIQNNKYNNNNLPQDNDLYRDLSVIIFISNGNYTRYYTNGTYDGILPEKYDLRDYGYVTPVKDQKDGGNCWAFYAIGALESAMLKILDEDFDLSEENMKNLMEIYSPYGWSMETNTGGYDGMSIGYLVSWLGPVYESDDPYYGTTTLSPLLNSVMHVQNIAFLKRNSFTDNTAIKEAIMKYGAVASEIYYSSSYYNFNHQSYFYDGTLSPNHGVLIVGWDDSYSRFNFKGSHKIPAGDGAWIVKNSWGSEWGNDGYFYVSYYDTKFAEVGKEDCSFVFILNDTINYDKNYQYDLPGKTDYFINSTNTVWYKNIFNSTDNEYLTAVSTYFEKDTNWELSIKINNILKHQENGFSKAGYYTFNLNKLLQLNKGDLFEVIFKISVDANASFPISEIVSLNKYFYKENVSFVSYDGVNWQDLYQLNWVFPQHSYNSQVACIKAFTILNPINTEITLDITDRIGNTVNLTASVYNEYGFLINSGNVTFKIGNIEDTVAIINGFAKYTLVLENEVTTVIAEFKAVGYNDSSINKELYNPLINTEIELNVMASNSNNNQVNISAHITDFEHNPVTSGFVTFHIGDETYIIEVTDGFANLTNITAHILGENMISANYTDNFHYKESSTTKLITISLIETKIELIINQDNPTEIIAQISDLNGNPVNSGLVIFEIEGKIYQKEVINGIANITYFFDEIGSKSISANYTDPYTYDPSTCNKFIEINKKEVYMNIINIIQEDNDFIMEISIPNCFKEYRVHLILNGEHSFFYSKNKSVIIDLENLDDGFYDYSIELISQIYNASNLTGNFTIDTYKTKIIASDTIIYKNGEYSVLLEDKYNNPVSNREVFLSANGKTYKSRTNQYGIAVFTLSLNPNTYDTILDFIGDDKYIKSTKTVTIIVKNSIITPSNKKYTKNSKYNITLLDTHGNPLSNENINITINNVNYQFKTDSYGKISININLDKGTYHITIINPSTYEEITQTLNILPRITGNNMKMYFNSAKTYKVRVYGDNGKIVGAGEIVKFKIGKKTYNVKTDKNGYASLKIKRNPGTYIIYATYKGYKVHNKIIIKPILTAKNITKKKGKKVKFTAKLVNTNGKGLKGKKIIFRIKGKKYTAKTNKYGVARITIKLKLKVGRYTIVSAYGNAKATNSIIIKK